MATLPLNDRLTGPFLATLGQTDFPADFPLIDADGVIFRVERIGVTVDLVAPAFAIVNVVDDGFTVRLAAPALVGDRCWIWAKTPPVRDRDHPYGGATKSKTLNGDAVSAQAQLQEHDRDRARGLHFPLGEAGQEFPRAAFRRESVPVFDALGDLQTLPAVAVLNAIGIPFADDGAWGGEGDPLTYDDGAFV